MSIPCALPHQSSDAARLSKRCCVLTEAGRTDAHCFLLLRENGVRRLRQGAGGAVSSYRREIPADKIIHLK